VINLIDVIAMITPFRCWHNFHRPGFKPVVEPAFLTARRHARPGIQYLAPGTRHLVPGTRAQPCAQAAPAQLSEL
jgi:hypothetical protein